MTMTHKRTEIRKYAKQAIEGAGAKIIAWGVTGGNHQYILFEIMGQRGQFFFQSTPRTHAKDLNMMAIARRVVRQTAEGRNR